MQAIKPTNKDDPAHPLRSGAWRWLSGVWLLLGGLGAASSAAACSVVATPTIQLGTISSFALQTADGDAGSGSGGLSCSGLDLALLTNQFIYARLDSANPLQMTHAITGHRIPFAVSTQQNGVPMSTGAISSNLAGLNLLSLGGANSEVQMFVQRGGANVAAGVYTGSFDLRWFYATCPLISAAGVCIGSWNTSPGITQSCLLGLCTLDQGSLPGSGLPVTVNVTLNVAKDCVILAAPDVDFGVAALPAQFPVVVQSLQVSCTLTEGYVLKLDMGDHASAPWRQLQNGSDALRYNLYQADGATLWDDTGNPVGAVGTGFPQSFSYHARIDAMQPPVRAGAYADSVRLIVEF